MAAERTDEDDLHRPVMEYTDVSENYSASETIGESAASGDDRAAEDAQQAADQPTGDLSGQRPEDQPGEHPESGFDVDLSPDAFGTGESPASGDDGLDIDFNLAPPSSGTAESEINLDFGTEAETEQAEEVEEETSGAEQAALEEFRADLRSKIGDWYAVHTYSGMENRVKQNLDNRVSSLNMEDYVFEVVVPTEEVTEIKNGQRKQVRRTTLPGYVLVRMDLTDESWSAVRHTPSVTGFVGHSNNPVPLGLDEVEKMLAPAVTSAAAAAAETPARKKKTVEVADYAVGDSVMVVDGPFAGVHASITELNSNAGRVKALVEILGRETPVDLTFSQIQKV
jgi:transcriptional antiterminator NusG